MLKASHQSRSAKGTLINKENVVGNFLTRNEGKYYGI